VNINGQSTVLRVFCPDCKSECDVEVYEKCECDLVIECENVDKLLLSNMDIGERNMFSQKSLYALNVMKKGYTLEALIKSLAGCNSCL
jgi:hypothetical protein